MDFFTHERVSDHIIRIRDLTQTAFYLIEGKNQSCLLDTGTGIGNARAYVDQLTDQKYFVILTHGHLDHAGGAEDFSDKDVYLHKADRELMKEKTSIEDRLEYLEFVTGRTDIKKEMCAKTMDADQTLPLEHGQIFDLGDITLEIIHVPGHTKGMCMVLIREERTILFGDGCGVSVLLLDEDASSVEEYLESLLELKTHEPEYDKIIRNHGSCTSPKELLDEVIKCCENILNGTDDKYPAKKIPMHFEDAVFAKALGEDDHERADGKQGNVAYRPCKIRKNQEGEN